MDWQALHGTAFKDVPVLVTGGAGFIGSHIVQALVQLGARISVIDNLANGKWSNLDGFGDGVAKTTGDILDADAVRSAMAGCRYVFHEAALGSVPKSVETPVPYHDANVMGTLSVLQAARDVGVERVVYAGSSSAYGNPPKDGPKVEDQPILPLSPYAATKLAGEAYCRAWSASYGVDTAVLRYFNIFGPRQDPHSAYAAVIAAFAKALLNNEAARIYGDGEQSRDFTFVHNAVHANLLAARCAERIEGEVFNVATGHRVSVNQLYQAMADSVGKGDLKAEHLETRTGDVKHSLADISKGGRVLGYSPIVKFEDGLKATIDWYADAIQ